MIDIDARELLQRIQNGERLQLLDVREPIEFHTWNVGGLNLPVGELSKKVKELEWQHNEEIIVVCRVGLRSATAKSILELEGYKNIRNLTGGLMAFQRIQSYPSQ